MKTELEAANALWNLRKPDEQSNPVPFVYVYTWRGPGVVMLLTELDTPEKIARRLDGHVLLDQPSAHRIHTSQGPSWEVAQKAFEALRVHHQMGQYEIEAVDPEANLRDYFLSLFDKEYEPTKRLDVGCALAPDNTVYRRDDHSEAQWEEICCGDVVVFSWRDPQANLMNAMRRNLGLPVDVEVREWIQWRRKGESGDESITITRVEGGRLEWINSRAGHGHGEMSVSELLENYDPVASTQPGKHEEESE
jgi:hypothetical protein